MPRVSIIIPVFNREKYIAECIQSVILQTFKDWDLWVVDDSSTDGTLEVIESFDLQQLKILQVEHDKQATARNAALSHVDSEFVAFLDSDDWWEPDKLDKQLPVFIDRPKIGLVYSDAYRFDVGIGRQSLTAHEVRSPRRGRVFRDLCLGHNFVITSTVVMRRQCFEEVGLFEPKFVPSEDFHMWLRVAAHYEFEYVPEPLAWYRFHDEQNLIENIPRNHFKHIEAMQSVENSYTELTAQILKPMHGYMASLAYNAGRYALSRGDYVTAYYSFSLSVKISWNWRAAIFLLPVLALASFSRKAKRNEPI